MAKDYDRTHRIHPLLFVTVIVNEGQGESIADIFEANEAYACYLSHGRGTASNDFYEVTGSGDRRKTVVHSIIREDRWPIVKKTLEERFAVSQMAKGIAYSVKITAVMAVSIYKMLSNNRFFEKPLPKKEKKGLFHRGKKQ